MLYYHFPFLFNFIFHIWQLEWKPQIQFGFNLSKNQKIHKKNGMNFSHSLKYGYWKG